MAGIDLHELYEARAGRPTEPRAMRTIATFAVIPATLAGLLVGTLLTSETAPFSRLLSVAGGAAGVAAFGTLAAVWATYRLLGFRPVAALADVLIGGFTGFLAGGFLSQLLDAWWPLLLAPLGAVVGLLVPRPARPDETPREPPQKPEAGPPPQAKGPDIRPLGVALAVGLALAAGCARPGEPGPTPTVSRHGPLTPSSDPSIPPDPEARFAIIKVALVNFVGAGHADGGTWPARVEDLLSGEAQFNGAKANPGSYRIAPTGARPQGAPAALVIYEATAPREGGFAGYADGSVLWRTAEQIQAELVRPGVTRP